MRICLTLTIAHWAIAHSVQILILVASFCLLNVALCTEEYGGGGEASGGLGAGAGEGGDYGQGGKLDGDIGGGGYGGYGGKLDGGLALGGIGGYEENAGYGGDIGGYGHEDYGGHYSGSGHSISAAIQSHHSVKSVPVYSTGGHGKPTLVDVDAGVAPIVLNIKSRSSPVIPKHKHYGLGGSYHKSRSMDKAEVLVHEVRKPVIHELKEVIMPYRLHTQRVKPVRSKIQTFVHHGKHGGYY